MRRTKAFFPSECRFSTEPPYFAGCGSIKVDDEGVEKIAEARAKGRGVLILASHTGGWAIASGELAAKFPDAAIVGADRERAEIRKLVDSSRARTAPETLSDFSDGFSPVAVYAALRAGRIAAMHADRGRRRENRGGAVSGRGSALAERSVRLRVEGGSGSAANILLPRIPV